MKYFIFCILAAVLFVACAKSSDPAPMTPVAPIVPAKPVVPVVPVAKSTFPSLTFDYYSSRYMRIMTFGFNSDHQLTYISSLTYDTNTQNSSGYLDTSRITFSYTLAGRPPSSYEYSWFNSAIQVPATGATEKHLLFFDGQDRLITDSSISKVELVVNQPYLYTSTYEYFPGYIIVHNGIPDPRFPGTVYQYVLDSLILENGNITRNSTYYIAGSPPALYETDKFTYSTDKNPMQDVTISKYFGPLLMTNNFLQQPWGDFISNNIINHANRNCPTVFLYDYSYTPLHDSSTRVTQNVGKDASGNVQDQLNYQYAD